MELFSEDFGQVRTPEGSLNVLDESRASQTWPTHQELWLALAGPDRPDSRGPSMMRLGSGPADFFSFLLSDRDRVHNRDFAAAFYGDS